MDEQSLHHCGEQEAVKLPMRYGSCLHPSSGHLHASCILYTLMVCTPCELSDQGREEILLWVHLDRIYRYQGLASLSQEIYVSGQQVRALLKLLTLQHECISPVE